MSSDSDDLERLTPNYFLISSSSISKSLDFVEEDQKNLRKQWRISQKLAENFLNGWVGDYLPILTKTTKWYGDSRNFHDMVILVDN